MPDALLIFSQFYRYGTTSDVGKPQHFKSNIMSIKIQVAICTQCNGYYSSAPLEKKDAGHPEIIDHFFYHGEPWFTLEQETFDQCRSYEHTEIAVVDLHEHAQNDHQYCHCKKNVITEEKILSAGPKLQKSIPVAEKYEIETEIYFKDLYYTYNNFHGIQIPAASNYNSNRKYG